MTGEADAPFFPEQKLEEALELARGSIARPIDLVLELSGDVPELLVGAGPALRARVATEVVSAACERDEVVVSVGLDARDGGASLALVVGDRPAWSFDVALARTAASGRDPLRGARVAVHGEPRAARALAARLARAGVHAVVATDVGSPACEAIVIDVSAHRPALDVGALRHETNAGDRPVVVTTSAELAPDARTTTISRPTRTTRVVSALRTLLVPVDTRAGAAATRPLRTLVVDDQPVNTAFVIALLRHLGEPEVSRAANGWEAIEACRAERYDLVLMDLQMPVLGGLEATERILEEAGTHKPRVVAITASTFEEDRARCQRAGMRGFLSKPVTEEQLLEQLELTRHGRRKRLVASER